MLSGGATFSHYIYPSSVSFAVGLFEPAGSGRWRSSAEGSRREPRRGEGTVVLDLVSSEIRARDSVLQVDASRDQHWC